MLWLDGCVCVSLTDRDIQTHALTNTAPLRDVLTAKHYNKHKIIFSCFTDLLPPPLPPCSSDQAIMGTGMCGKKPRHSAKKKQYKKALCTARRPKDVDQIQVLEGGRGGMGE